MRFRRRRSRPKSPSSECPSGSGIGSGRIGHKGDQDRQEHGGGTVHDRCCPGVVQITAPVRRHRPPKWACSCRGRPYCPCWLDNRILIGDAALGHRAGLRTAGTRPWSRKHTSTEASRPSASGPVSVESGLSAGNPVSMTRGGPDPGLPPLSWPWARARAGTPNLCVVSSHPPSAKPTWWACIRSPSVLVPSCYPHGVPVPCIYDVVQRILYMRESAGQLVLLPQLCLIVSLTIFLVNLFS